MLTVDLNADLGELPGSGGEEIDAGLMAVVTSANIATGGHAGDADSMERVCRLAARHGVSVGAHLSFEDRVGFGRRVPDRIDADLVARLRAQLHELLHAGDRVGVAVSYVKPHGALYHLALHRRDVATAVIDSVVDTGLAILSMHPSQLQVVAEQAGLATYAEFFADRGYLPTGELVPRGMAGDLVHIGLVDRVLQAVTTGSVTAANGESIGVQVDSVCVHGDSPDAVAHARQIRQGLVQAGVRVRAFTGTT